MTTSTNRFVYSLFGISLVLGLVVTMFGIFEPREPITSNNDCEALLASDWCGIGIPFDSLTRHANDIWMHNQTGSWTYMIGEKQVDKTTWNKALIEIIQNQMGKV